MRVNLRIAIGRNDGYGEEGTVPSIRRYSRFPAGHSVLPRELINTHSLASGRNSGGCFREMALRNYSGIAEARAQEAAQCHMSDRRFVLFL